MKEMEYNRYNGFIEKKIREIEVKIGSTDYKLRITG